MFTKLENIIVLVILALVLGLPMWLLWGRVGASELYGFALVAVGIALATGVVVLGIYILGQLQRLVFYAIGRLKRKDPI